MQKKQILFLCRKKIILYCFVTLFLFACHRSSVQFAPRNINDYVIGMVTTKAIKDDIPYLNKVGYYFFDSHGNYSLYYDQTIFEKGEYAYKRIDMKTAALVVSYSDQTGLNNYKTILEFTSPEGGIWKGSYEDDSLNTEKGTFTILRHGYN